MARWFDVARVDELSPGSCCVVDLDGMAVAVFHIGNEYYAIEDVCPHDGGDLASGELVGYEIICPRHGARFSIRTGAVLAPPAYVDLRTFPVRIAEGKVQIEAE